MSTEYRTAVGRADAEGNVYLTRGEEEVYVGQYPDVSPEEAYAYFAKKYADLVAQVGLLEQRAIRGASVQSVKSGLTSIKTAIAENSAVGDVSAIERRLEALETKLADLGERQHEEAKAAIDTAIAQREAIVTRIEQLAAADPSTHQWKTVTPQITELFDEWKAHQKSSPRLPKTVADALWTRFRAARTTLESERRAFFSRLDGQHKAAKATKAALVDAAKALDPEDRSAIGEYRRLLDQWKAAGRVGGKADDALWDEFKAAGDALYAIKKEEVAKENAEYSANLEAKRALIDEAEALLPVRDVAAARKALVSIQTRWDEIGRVPRDAVRSVEDRIRKVERQVKAAEDAKWKADDPETRERANSMLTQLQDSIRDLEGTLAAAEAAGDARAAAEASDALEARRAWLAALDK